MEKTLTISKIFISSFYSDWKQVIKYFIRNQSHNLISTSQIDNHHFQCNDSFRSRYFDILFLKIKMYGPNLFITQTTK